MNLPTIIKNKCPRCRKGNVFNTKWNILLFKIPQTNKNCSVCNYKVEKETGFYFGAMFVSYWLAVAQFIVTFLILYVGFKQS